MAKVLSISDMHGSNNWEKAVKEFEYDYVVFLGDVCDAWENHWPQQGENIQNIFKFIREDPEHHKFCIGNHDFAYLTGTREGMYVSGHQHEHIAELRALFTANLDIIDLAAEIGGVVFSHAGFSDCWTRFSLFKQLHYEYDEWPKDDGSGGKVWDESEFSIKLLNEYWHNRTHIPGDPEFRYGFDEILDWYGTFSGSGDEVSQGPLWIRPESLMKQPFFPKQVVGHTEFCIDKFFNIKSDDNMLIITDSRKHNIFEVIDTEKFESREWVTLREIGSYHKAALYAVNNVKSRKVCTKEELAKEVKKTKRNFDIDKLFEWGFDEN